MVYQVLISYNMTNEILLDVADSLEEFGKTLIMTLKWEITHKIFGHERFYVKLIFGNTLLEDNQTLGFYKVEPLSVLLVVLRMPGVGVYQVLVNYNDKQNELLDVANSFEKFSNTTIVELKEKFRRKFPDAPYPKRLRMIFGNDLLEDNQTLRFYKITHLSVLLVVMRMSGGGKEDTVYRVCFRFDARRNEVLDVADSLEEFENTTIRELKERWFALKCKESERRDTAQPAPGVSGPEDLRVMSGCHQLEDNQTIGFYRIDHLSLLYIIQKMPGGGVALFPLEEVIPRTESMERMFYNM